jgi:predicted Zn finger-like uncharacterized protein
MRLTCPNCRAQYEVADSAIPARGRDVQCSSCGHAWFERPPEVSDPEPVPAAAPAARVTTPSTDTAAPAPKPVEPKAETPAEPALSPAPKRAIDPAVAEILRAEAAREARERRQEAETGLQSQEEFSFDQALATRSDAAPVAEDTDTPGAATARRTEVPRRDLLPDIEEINSSLRAKSVLRAGAADAMTEEELEERARRGRGFRLGFSSILLVALFALLLYSYADVIVRTVPALGGPMEAYVEQVNALRLWLDGRMAEGASAISAVLQSAGN